MPLLAVMADMFLLVLMDVLHTVVHSNPWRGTIFLARVGVKYDFSLYFCDCENKLIFIINIIVCHQALISRATLSNSSTTHSTFLHLSASLLSRN
jgi:hypothetical protein